MSLEQVRARLDAFVGDIDGDDPKARRRRQILMAATELFIEQGYRKTSVDEVAQRAGVAKGTVYLYYKNKTDLLFAAAAQEKKQIIDRFDFFFDKSIPARQRLRKWVIETITIATDMPLTRGLLVRGELKAIMADAPPELRAQSERDRDELLGELITEIAEPGALEPDLVRDRAAVLAGIAGMSTAIEQMSSSVGISPRKYAKTMADMLLGGLFGKHKRAARDEDPTNDAP